MPASPIETASAEALETLRKGGVLLFPSDTLWTMACDACNAEAVERLLALLPEGERPVVLVESDAMLMRYAVNVPDLAWQLLEVADKPLSLVLPRGRDMAPGLAAADGSVAFRLVEEAFCRRLMRGLRRPLASFEAVAPGLPMPTRPELVAEGLRSAADLVSAWRQGESLAGRLAGMIRIRIDGSIQVLRH